MPVKHLRLGSNPSYATRGHKGHNLDYKFSELLIIKAFFRIVEIDFVNLILASFVYWLLLLALTQKKGDRNPHGVLTKYGEIRKVHSAYNERRSAQNTYGGSNPLTPEPEWNALSGYQWSVANRESTRTVA